MLVEITTKAVGYRRERFTVRPVVPHVSLVTVYEMRVVRMVRSSSELKLLSEVVRISEQTCICSLLPFWQFYSKVEE